MSDTPDITPRILQSIQGRLDTIDGRLDRMDGRLDQIDEMRREMRERFDNLISIFGGAHRDQERRLSYLEARMDRVDPPAAPRRRR